MAQSVIINNIVYTDVNEVDIPKSTGGTARYYDASNADVAAANVLNGKKFVGASGEDTGTMPDNGATGGEIGAKNGTVAIPAGYTSGGTVAIRAAAVADLQSQFLLSGKTVLGVSGTLAMPVIAQDSTTKVLSIS